MSIEALKEDIKNNKLKNLYLFYGPEEYLKKYYLESIEKLILSEDLKALNRIVLEGKIDIKKLIDNCETLPVFAEKKIVIVKNSGVFKSKKKSGEESKGKNQKDDFTAYLENVPETTCLIFYEEEIDKRMKAVDMIKKKGLIVEFTFQKPAELIKWVAKVLRSYKKTIDQNTAAQLVDNCEQGMNDILNEINKLVLYLGDRPQVTSRDVEKVCTKSIKSRIFDLTDAISEKNAGKALKILDEMVILKEPLPKILFMIARQFRMILEMKLLYEEGLRTDQAASKMAISPYAAGKVYKQSGGFTVDMLKEAISECLELDLGIKTGKVEDRIAAELLIAKFSK